MADITLFASYSLYSKLLDYLVSKASEEKYSPLAIKSYANTLGELVIWVYRETPQENITLNINGRSAYFETEEEFQDSRLYRFALVDAFAERLSIWEPKNECEEQVKHAFKLRPDEKLLVDMYTIQNSKEIFRKSPPLF